MADPTAIARVHLDWRDPSHYDARRKLPCRICRTHTNMRDRSGAACHKSCAEAEIARELAGGPETRIAT